MDEVELIDKRKPREKHFLQKDGTIRAEIYNTDIHYLKNGKYEEIDNTLIEENDSLVNKSNDYRVEFKKDINKSLMKMSKDNHFIDFKLKEKTTSTFKNGMRKVSANNITSDINDNIKVEYQTLSNKVKETIVLQDANYDELSFKLDTDLKLELIDKEIIAKDENNKVIFRIEKPFMFDSNNNRNDNIYYSINKTDNGYEVKLVLDNKWLNSKDRAYPVYVDPTITNEVQPFSIHDTYIYPGDTGINKSNEDIIKAGYEKVNGTIRENRTLMKFDLPEIGTGSEIVDASINLIPYPSLTNNKSAKNYLVTIHQITKDWDESTANWEIMHDKYNNLVYGISECVRGYVEYGQLKSEIYAASFTSLVKKWYRNVPNYGIMIKAANSDYVDDDFQVFFSNNNIQGGANPPRPILCITYKNQNGLESYLDYKEQEFTIGKTYVNTYNGNLTGIFEIGETYGGKMPVSLELVYNTNDVVLAKQTNFGKGCKLNIEQFIKESTIDGYLEYIDSDGTIHYFHRDFSSQDDSKYYDEDGLNYTIELQEDKCILNDSNGNILIFEKEDNIYKLKEIQDVSNNIITIEYENGKVTKIKDVYNSKIELSYGEEIIQISNPDGIVKLRYSNSRLVAIESKLGLTEFDYDSNDIITMIKDCDGTKIKYAYYENKPYRIMMVAMCGIDGSEGQKMIFDYGFNLTRIKDNTNKNETIIFNNDGNVDSRNSLKNEEDIDGAYSLTQEYGGYGNVKNKLMSSSIPITYIKNYLRNTGFEGNEIFFINDENITSIISDKVSNTGFKSLKITNSLPNKGIEQIIAVPKGAYYTFSGYFKSTIDYIIYLSYVDKEGTNVYRYEKFDKATEFERNDISIYYDENAVSDLKIRIVLQDIGTMYLDDIQLEKGEVANLYNIIENSDFSDGLNGWTTEVWKEGKTIDPTAYFECVSINNGKNKALHISMNPLISSVVKRSFDVSGKEGDTYTIAFWYKNDGVEPCRQYAGNNVTIIFHPTDGEAEYCFVSSKNFNQNENTWQYFSYRSTALEDFDRIDIIYSQDTQANDLYITNISLYKEVTSGEYQYDTNGNIVSISDSSNEISVFKYDNDNKLISATSPKGSNYKFEYDNNNKDNILSAISSNGVTNEIKYDQYGNPISTKVTNRIETNITNGNFRIRSKGTKKYVKSEMYLLLLEESECSNTIWKFNENENNHKFKIHNAILQNLCISFQNNKVILVESDVNNEFEFEKCDNGSFLIYLDIGLERLYLKAQNDELIAVNELDRENPEYQFFIEKKDDTFIENKSTYTNDGKFMTSLTDSNDNITHFSYNMNNGQIESCTLPNKRITTYNYNSKGLISSISSSKKTIKYTYDEHNNISRINDGDREFSFEYDNFLNPKNVKIGKKINLIENNYSSTNGNLESIRFGNNDIIYYSYDEFDRLKRISSKYSIYDYKYDNNGNIAKIISDGEEKKYKYDSANRLYEYTQKNNDNYFKVNYTYDSNNNFKNINYKNNIKEYSINNTYSDDNVLIKTLIDNNEIKYKYDNLGRIVEKNIGNKVIYNYEFLTKGRKTTDLVKKYIIDNNNEYSYEYDNMNNVTNEYLNNTLISKFYYDEFNQLVRADNYIDNIYTLYNYNNNGNMINKTKMNLNTDEQINSTNLSYDNENWCDLLTSYNGNYINYDNIGNPISIGDSISLTWTNGRNLSKYNDNKKNINIEFTYDSDNNRESKIVNGIVTEYFLDGENIIFEKTGDSTICYMYDQTGVIGFKYNELQYYYIKNNFEDVIGIKDSSGNIIAKYTYDSYGNILSIKDSNNLEIEDSSNIAIINPIRYRSYYFDNETNLYYLKTRYYNPEWARFINADDTIGINEDILSNNLFLYVSNNPINNYDEDGRKKKTTKKKKSNNLLKVGIGIGLAAIGVAAVVMSGGYLLPTVIGAAKIVGVCTAAAVACQVAKNVINTVVSGGGAKDIKENIFDNVDDAAANGVLAGGAVVAAMGVGEYYLEHVAQRGFSFFNGSVQGMYNTPKKPGGTLIKVDKFNRFHLDLDRTDGLHYHVGKTKSLRKVHHIIIKWVFKD